MDLHSQLIKLGDMMGDGLHHEPGGKWITKEYNKVLKARGHGKQRANNSAAINQAMEEKLKVEMCPKCGGKNEANSLGIAESPMHGLPVEISGEAKS